LGRLSGPLMDRIDIRVDLAALDPMTLTTVGAVGESSTVVGDRVLLARDRSALRWKGTPWRTSAEVPGAVVRRSWRPDRREADLLDQAVRSGRLTGRGYDRVLRLALTAADLFGRERPSIADLATALALRCGEAL